MPRTCAIIPARGGSKRIPRKNLQMLGGRTLIEWAVEQARQAGGIDEICVTSDDAEILQHAATLGVNIIRRPADLARDDTPGIAPVLHAMDELGLAANDELVLLQPTSPFRSPQDIEAALRLRRERGAPCCVSVRRVEDHPAWMFRIAEDDTLHPYLDETMPDRSQDLSALHVPNGAIYIALVGRLRASGTFFMPGTVAYVMPAERSLDIDTPFHLDLARAMWAAHHPRTA